MPSFRRRRRSILWRCCAASWPWRAAVLCLVSAPAEPTSTGESGRTGADSPLLPGVGWPVRESAHSPGPSYPGISPDQSASSGAVDAPPWNSRCLPSAYDLAIPLRVVRGAGRERITTAVHRDPAKPEMGGRHHLCRDSGGVAVCGGAVRLVFSPGRGLGDGGTHHDRVDAHGTHDGRAPAAGRAAVAPSLGSRQPIAVRSRRRRTGPLRPSSRPAGRSRSSPRKR